MNLEEEELLEPSIELIEKLIEALKQEVLSPDILPFQSITFKTLQQALKDQDGRIKEYLREDEEEGTSRQDKSWKYLIYKSETEKLSYVLKEYLRVRLHKIEQFGLYLFKNQAQAEKLLSENELQFMKKFAELKYRYLDDNVLKNLVKNYRGLGGLEAFFGKGPENKLMLDTQQSRVDLQEPNLESYVFARIESNPQMARFNYDIEAGNVEGQPVMRAGCTVYTPYKNVMGMVQESNASLI